MISQRLLIPLRGFSTKVSSVPNSGNPVIEQAGSSVKGKRIVSGIQATGGLHIGNYLGTLCKWKEYQQENETFFFIADLHSLSDLYNNRPESQVDPDVSGTTVQTLAMLLASGLDPNRGSVYIGSQVPMVPEIFWLLSTIVPLHWLNRMSQFKSKKSENSTAALYSYPILMAADIISVQGELVPVGSDQTQHIEFTRECVYRINKLAGRDVLSVPKALMTQGERIMSLHDASKKMSKSDSSDKNKILMMDSPESITSKIMKAKTDSMMSISKDPHRIEIGNLVQIYASFANISKEQVFKEFDGAKIVDFKRKLADLVITRLMPIQDNYYSLIKDQAYLKEVADLGKMKAAEESYKTLTALKDILKVYNS